MVTRATLLPSILLTEDPAGDGSAHPRTTRDWLVDVTFFVVAVAVGLATFYSEFPDGPGQSAVAAADLAIGVVTCMFLWGRRRWPVPLALVAAPLGAVSTMAGAAAIILLFTVAVHRPWRVVALLAALNMAGTFVYAALYPDEELGYVLLVIVCDLILAAVVAWGMFIRARRELVLSLRERARAAEADQATHMQQARDSERTRIAREMHDVLAHRISLLSMHAGALEFRPDAPPAEIAAAAGVIRASAHAALEDLREVIGVLRSDARNAGGAEVEDLGTPPDRPQPTLGDLPALLDESRSAGMRIREELELDLTAGGDSGSVPASVGRTVYRIVQEGLTNARKHAGGASVLVRLTGSPKTGITAEVTSRAPVGGAVSPAIPGAGTGIVGLTERTTLAGGKLYHGPTAEGGFRLRAWLPWPS